MLRRWSALAARWFTFRGRSGRPPRVTLRFETLEGRDLFTASPFALPLAAPPTPAQVSPRIVNGQPTSGFPSVGLIGDATGSFCSGTLITSRHVLTAAHCAVGLGATEGRFIVGGATYATSRIFIHPRYQSDWIGTDVGNDIAIFELSQPVVGITPSPINRIPPGVGQLLTLVGFGIGGPTGGDFGIKRVGTTPIDGVSATLVTWNFDNYSESNTAPGDSGGPAFLQRGGVYYVAGVTSGGSSDDAGIGDHSFDTRVDAYAAWIDSIVGATPNPVPPSPSAPSPRPGIALFAVSGSGGVVNVYHGDGSLRLALTPFAGFPGALRVSTGDVNRDGTNDIIVGAEAANGHVKVFDGVSGGEIRSFFAFEGFEGGIDVGAGDVNGDGFADLIIGAGPGGNGHVKVFSGADGAILQSFLAFPDFNGGVTVAGGDVNGDGLADVLVAAGAGGNGHVKVFGARGGLLQSFLAFEGSDAFDVGGGDVNGDGRDDVIVGSSMDAIVAVYSGLDVSLLNAFSPYPAYPGSVGVAGTDLDRDGIADVLIGTGRGGPPHLQAFRGLSTAATASFYAFDPGSLEGIDVG